MNKALAAIGWTKQTAKGSIADQPDFWQGVTGGKMVDFGVDQKPIEETTGLGAGTGEYRESVAIGADYGVIMRPLAIASLLQAILGTIQSVDASGTVTHTITLGASVAYYTLFGKLDSEYRKAGDSKLDELSIEWDGNKPVEVNATWAGCAGSWDASGSSWTPTNDERLADPFLASAGTYQHDVDGSTLADTKVLGGKITFKRKVEADIISGTITPDDVNEGSIEVEIELKVRAASLADQRSILTGTPTGTTIAEAPVYGSASIAFALGAASVTLAATKIPFSCDTPEADPKGGPVELTLKGGCYIATGQTTPITATVVNTLAAY